MLMNFKLDYYRKPNTIRVAFIFVQKDILQNKEAYKVKQQNEAEKNFYVSLISKHLNVCLVSRSP